MMDSDAIFVQSTAAVDMPVSGYGPEKVRVVSRRVILTSGHDVSKWETEINVYFWAQFLFRHGIKSIKIEEQKIPATPSLFLTPKPYTQLYWITITVNIAGSFGKRPV